MPTDRGAATDERPWKTLTRRQIDERIQHVAGMIAAGTEGPSGHGTSSDSDLDPRWITAAELVRRVRPFLVYN